MKLNWIEVAHFGPFAVPAKLYLDPRVTVLTGANDTGKTSLLRALHLTFSGTGAEAQQVNQDRIDNFSGKWQDDPEVLCNVGLQVTEHSKSTQSVGGAVEVDDELVMFRRLNQGGAGFALRHVVRGKGQVVSVNVKLPKPPQAITLPPTTEVRDILPLSGLNEVEDKLIKLGFGQGFTPQQHEAQARSQRIIRVARAQDALNRRLKEILPPALPLEFRLNEVGDKGAELNLSLVDPLNCFVPVGCRGAGIRRMLSLMGTLLSLNDVSRLTLVLIDEPENSLHADAQHVLRRLLEKLAESPFIQVVYSTHSPSMINTMRPGTIRVLERRLVNDKPTSIIQNQAFNDNFVRVRSSLGITPADSLLYTPVTVVVEGPTEVRCLPVIFEKLKGAGTEGFEDVDDILSQVHFLDGTGDSYEYMCRLAKSQNAKPLVFLDGDKSTAAKKLKEEHPDVPLVVLDKDEEFENLVPAGVYIAAVAKLVQDGTGNITMEAFQKWTEAHKAKPSWLFSKRVQRWLEDEFDKPLYKPLVMEQAVLDVAVGAVKVEPLKLLLDTMRTLLRQQ